MRPQLFLIDAHSLCYRAYYGVKHLSNSKGQPTNAVFGFCNILRKLLADLKPDYIAVCFDVGKKTLRQEKFADYKVQRQSMPDDLVAQMGMIRELVQAYNLPIFELEGYEADDVMATLALKYAGKDVDAVIVTEDKDMGQLVNTHIMIYSAKNDKMLHAAEVKEKFGVAPGQIVDYLALAGDASDNIPGVFGIGEVTARKLLDEFESLEGIYKDLSRVKAEKLREKLSQGKSSAFMSKELATLHADVPLKVSLDQLARREPDVPRLRTLFQDLEFRRFEDELSAAPVVEDFMPEPFDPVVTVGNGPARVTVVYDLKSLLKEGRAIKPPVFDVCLAGYLLTGGQNKYDAASLSWQFLNKKPHAGVLAELYGPLMKALAEQGLSHLLNDVETPLVDVLVRMEADGVRLDVDVLRALSKECQGKIEELEKGLYKAAGTEFNINSPKQLSDVLFTRLQLPVIKKTKTGFSTDEEVLTRLAAQHELPAMILEYRQIAKLKSTYIDALPQMVKEDGRIHATFNQTGAETGRLSSNNPNLQNIPIRTDFGRRIRAAFVPFDKGHVLLSADYSQIELRILAHLAGDPNLQKAFREGQDIHRHTASLMFDVPEDKIDAKMRYAAKRINFGIIYGMSAFGLAKDLDVTQREAQDFINTYFLRYPNVRTFLDGEIEKARELGYVVTMFNRRRYLPDINNRNVGLRQFAERQAINAPIQGTAADLIKKAMVNIAEALSRAQSTATMIMTVHDELVFDVVEGDEANTAGIVRQHMEHAIDLSVPVETSVKAGKNWLDMKELA